MIHSVRFTVLITITCAVHSCTRPIELPRHCVIFMLIEHGFTSVGSVRISRFASYEPTSHNAHDSPTVDHHLYITGSQNRPWSIAIWVDGRVCCSSWFTVILHWRCWVMETPPPSKLSEYRDKIPPLEAKSIVSKFSNYIERLGNSLRPVSALITPASQPGGTGPYVIARIITPATLSRKRMIRSAVSLSTPPWRRNGG